MKLRPWHSSCQLRIWRSLLITLYSLSFWLPPLSSRTHTNASFILVVTLVLTIINVLYYFCYYFILLLLFLLFLLFQYSCTNCKIKIRVHIFLTLFSSFIGQYLLISIYPMSPWLSLLVGEERQGMFRCFGMKQILYV